MSGETVGKKKQERERLEEFITQEFQITHSLLDGYPFGIEEKQVKQVLVTHLIKFWLVPDVQHDDRQHHLNGGVLITHSNRA